ncbi:hypothetical protein ABQZ99_016220 [Xanthomonas hortorum pv. vitians]|uniref:ISXo8 transposase n=2 Tax=Xanthomonas hortorum TaxID=56454 RepID=A0A6V7CTD3_9XANT|nr:hypothetical protein [Xanthomonas hortorum]APP79539.1 hypothetical protein BJD10_07365 [Xanthomonas hortorum pv. gardneri]APP83632.1 hypothetical protein BI317_04985 [Xanthomonas hortorum pv. gardneri]ASW46462.1 hypothetical protein XJ27_11225 [Xanthomonas hortorum]EGD16421.1 hypothetical protein XGA_5019 [Xanthomonas hortorum ATCC 19865]KLA86043.1 hypothetical protein SM19410_22845 [Xanthomonas hortorum pv. gardneri]
MSTKFFEAKVHNTISLEELSEIIQTQKDDLDVETIKSMSHLLQGLCLNPQWFLEYLHQQLKNNFDSDETHGNLFSSNSFVLDRKLLHKKSGPYSFLVRANVWLAAADSLRRNTRKNLFAENLWHDHSFHLLTAGLLGPGYGTEICEYDFNACTGLRDEEVDTSAYRELRLTQGSALFMEKNKTVHTQLPPEQPSVSLNLIFQPYSSLTRQYIFDRIDAQRLRIKSIHYTSQLNSTATQNLVNICGSFANDNTKQIMLDLYRRLLDRVDQNEPALLILLGWFKKLGIEYEAIDHHHRKISPLMKHLLDAL